MNSARKIHPLRARRLGVWSGVFVLAYGGVSIAIQSLLLREAMVLMFGSELAWGIVLFAWLLGISLGALAGGALVGRLRNVDVALAMMLIALGACACVEIWIFGGLRAWLGVGPGELLPLPYSVVAALLFVTPVSILAGAIFPMVCGLIGDESPSTGRGSGPLGRVYSLESMGSLLGGAAFSFWAIEHLTPIEIALLLLAIGAGAASCLLVVTRPTRRSGYAAAICAGAALAFLVQAGEHVHRALVLRRWDGMAAGYKLCAEADSRYQNLALGQRSEQYTLYGDGQVIADFPDPYTYTPLAHFWMCMHPAPDKVLVLGGGAEGLLTQILLHPVKQVDYVEPDTRQLALVRSYLTEPDRAALHDPRVRVIHEDARFFIKKQQGRYDLVIARLAEPTSAMRARFFTDEFYRELRRAMTDRAVLCTTAAAAPADLSMASADYLASIRAVLDRHFPRVLVGWGDPAQILAATDKDMLSTNPAELARRYRERRVESDFFDPLWFEGATDWLDPEKLRIRSAQLDAAAGAQISTDLHPSIYLQRLDLWERMTSGTRWRLMDHLRRLPVRMAVGVLALAAALVAAMIYLRERLRGRKDASVRDQWRTKTAIVLSIGSTGFVTMALSIVWLHGFQNLYGYVYSRIGWIIAVFMGGLVVGCWLADRLATRHARTTGAAGGRWSILAAVDLLLAVLAATIPFVLPALGVMQGNAGSFLLVEIAITLGVACTGILGGAAFALSGGLKLADGGTAGAAAGVINAADHAGACLGVLMTGLWLVPVFGTTTAVLILTGMKLLSAGLLVAVRPR